MGAIQQAINTSIGLAAGIKKMQQFEEARMAKANLQAQNQKAVYIFPQQNRM